MSARATPYTGGAKARQILEPFAAAAACALMVALAGCSTVGLPFGPELTRTSALPVTARAALADTVDPSDWETVRRTIGTVPADQGRTLDWTNPRTGSTGAATVAAAPEPTSINACRRFSATISDQRGIRRYRGEACREIGGAWQLRRVSPDDASFS